MLLGDGLPLLSVGHTLSVIRDSFQNSLEEHLVGMSVLWDWKGRRDVGGFGSHMRSRLALRIMKHLATNLGAGAPNRLSRGTPYFSSGVHHDTSGPGSFHLLRIHLGLLVGDRVSQYFSCQSDRWSVMCDNSEMVNIHTCFLLPFAARTRLQKALPALPRRPIGLNARHAQL